MRLAPGWRVALLVALSTAGCELLVDRSATLMDAGPDVVAPSCVTSGCVECEPVTAPACPAGADAGVVDTGGDSSTPCPGGGDCDGIPDGRDPWPSRCNALQLDEGFAKVDKTRWGRSYNDLFIGVRSCGLLQWTAPPHFTIWAWLEPQTATTLAPGALAEVRLLPRLRGDWTLTLGLDVVGDEQNMGWPESQARSCALELRDGAFRLTSRIQSQGGSSSKRVGSFSLAGALVLQNWRVGSTHHCRVVPEAGKPVDLEHEIKDPLSKAGTVKLTLSNDAMQAPYVWLWIDWLRVFAP